jgi:hypothetical protein
MASAVGVYPVASIAEGAVAVERRLQRTSDGICQGMVQVNEVVEQHSPANFGIEGTPMSVLKCAAVAWPCASQGAGDRRSDDAHTLGSQALHGVGRGLNHSLRLGLAVVAEVVDAFKPED